MPPCLNCRSLACLLTHEGSAPGTTPPSSTYLRSSSIPYPRFRANRAPCSRTLSISFIESRSSPVDPRPAGTVLKRVSASLFFFFSTSDLSTSAITERTPQLISKPTPAIVTTPVSTSNAPTPPIGNPYPGWMSMKLFGCPADMRHFSPAAVRPTACSCSPRARNPFPHDPYISFPAQSFCLPSGSPRGSREPF